MALFDNFKNNISSGLVGFAGYDPNAPMTEQERLQRQNQGLQDLAQRLSIRAAQMSGDPSRMGQVQQRLVTQQAVKDKRIQDEKFKQFLKSPQGQQYQGMVDLLGVDTARTAVAKNMGQTSNNKVSTLIENSTYIDGLRNNLAQEKDKDKRAIIQQQIDDFAGLGGALRYDPQTKFNIKQSETAATQGLGFGERPMNKGEISTDEKFATIYTKYIDDGRGAKNVANLERLNDAQAILETAAKNGVAISGVTAGMLSNSPRLQAYFNEQGVMTEERVASVIQQSLKEILGGNFAEKEGEALIRRGYNAALSPEENLERLLDLKSQVQQLIETEQDSVDYFEKNNKSLRGYKGKTYTEESFIRDLSKDYKSDAVELSNEELKQSFRDAPVNSLWEKALEKELERRSRLGN